MLFSLFLPVLVSSCGDVCNEDDGAYIPNSYHNVPPTPSCESGFSTFRRPGYKWCMQVFPAENYNYTQAEALCAAHGAVVSGFQTDIERDWVASNGLVVMVDAYEVRTGAIWIGLQLREQCDVEDFYDLAACTPTNTSAYYWTDGYTTGYDQILWDNNAPTDIPYECAFLVTFDTGNVTYSTIDPSQVENYDCSVTDPEYEYQKIQGVLCGKLQTVYD